MFNFKEKKIRVFDSLEEMTQLLSGKDRVLLKGKWSGYFLFRQEDEFFLIKNKCPHQNKPLIEGSCVNKRWVCPWHQYRFDLKNGRGHGLYLDTHELVKDENGYYFTKSVFSLF